LPRWSQDLARPYVETALSAFGPERCLFGSNFPVDRPFAGFADLVDGLSALLPPGAADRVFVRNAIEWYRLDD
jgi:predicted TIM-barrel fold metal-dependent hydrolase